MARVLTIDDDPMTRLIISRVLANMGVQTDEATNGQEGLEKARQNPPDLILCDLDMPIMDGIETLATLQQDPSLHSIPLILITGAAREADEVRMLRGGAAGILRKPLEFHTLQELVRQHLPQS